MNSRERVLASLNHEEPDRIPYDLGSTPITSITDRAYKNLLAHLGIEEQFELTDKVQILAEVSETVLERLEVDTRGLWAKYNHTHNFNPVQEGEYWVNRDEWSLTYALPVDPEHAHWYDLIKFPLPQEETTTEELDAFPWPEGGARWRIEGLKEKARKYHQMGKATICRGVCAGVFEMALRIRGYEGFFPYLVLNPQACHRILEKITQHKGGSDDGRDAPRTIAWTGKPKAGNQFFNFLSGLVD